MLLVQTSHEAYKDMVGFLVEMTRDMVREHVKGDAWVMWAMAQRESIPVKMNACIE